MLVNHVNPVKNWVQYVSNPAIERLDSRITKCMSATNRTTYCYWLCWYASETFAYDDDGNQTLVTTFTGRWQVTYNGENRPVRWEIVSSNSNTPNSNTQTLLQMSYDHMGRRRTKNAQRFIYDGYLQLADNNGNIYVWDPAEPVATRPLVWLVLRSLGEGGYYTHDGNKNVSEVVAIDNDIAAHYDYAPFGALTAQRHMLSIANPWRFSSEYFDSSMDVYYFIHRQFNYQYGRWLSRDLIEIQSLYAYVQNSPISFFDMMGLYGKDVHYEFVYLYLMKLGASNAYEVSLGSQAPDHYWRTDPIVGGSMVRALFHNLNGLNATERKCFRKCVVWLAETADSDFLRGIYLHVIGDTYAHQDVDGSGYGKDLGHLFDGIDPDDVRRSDDKYGEIGLERFKAFIQELSRVLGSNDKTREFTDSVLGKLAEKDDNGNYAYQSLSEVLGTFVNGVVAPDEDYGEEDEDVNAVRMKNIDVARKQLLKCLRCVKPNIFKYKRKHRRRR